MKLKLYFSQNEKELWFQSPFSSVRWENETDNMRALRKLIMKNMPMQDPVITLSKYFVPSKIRRPIVDKAMVNAY